MKTLLAGISIGVGIASLAWLAFIDISGRFGSCGHGAVFYAELNLKDHCHE